MTFSHVVALAADLTGDVARVGSVVDRLTGRGETALVDGCWHRLQVRVKGRSVSVKARPGYDAGR
jgi:hypothetical protein